MAFYEVCARDVREGDLYANNGTVTAVIKGPHPGDGTGWKRVKRGQVGVFCGESFGSIGKPMRRIVVGRPVVES
jgi:hypothetical protein